MSTTALADGNFTWLRRVLEVDSLTSASLSTSNRDTKLSSVLEVVPNPGDDLVDLSGCGHPTALEVNLSVCGVSSSTQQLTRGIESLRSSTPAILSYFDHPRRLNLPSAPL
jgi:hypothetical protein